MATLSNRLTVLGVKCLTEPGLYLDGNGLYLQISKFNTKSWILRFKLGGRARDMGLGAYPSVSLAKARKRADAARDRISAGVDPIEARKVQRQKVALEKAKTITFKAAAERYMAAHEPAWRSAKHTDQWRSSLTNYVYPTLGHLPVRSIDTNLVMQVLEPVWAVKTITADRVRSRIEAVLDWAKARGHRPKESENPARWRGHLENLLPKKRLIHRVKHQPALPYEDIGGFMAELRCRQSLSARALEFLILTAARVGDVVSAKWDQVDWDARTWTIPITKNGSSHRVPLSDDALAVLQGLSEIRRNDWVFPSYYGKPLTTAAVLAFLQQQLGRRDLTAHGFRSTFRQWAAERTNFPREICEVALAHIVGDESERSYQRGDLLVRRRKLMDAWAKYCAQVKTTGEVVALRA